MTKRLVTAWCARSTRMALVTGFWRPNRPRGLCTNRLGFPARFAGFAATLVPRRSYCVRHPVVRVSWIRRVESAY